MKRILFSSLHITFLFSSSFIYSQCVLGDCNNGYGVFKQSNGDIYSGQWVDGQKSGFGYLDIGVEDYYFGEFKKNNKEGLGCYRIEGKDFYIGEMKENQKEGLGYLVYLDDYSYYAGKLVRDLKHGIGLRRDVTNDRWYFGEWINGEPNDRKAKKGKKTLLQGCLVGKCRNGEGLYVSDRALIGNWVKGKIKGTGLMVGGDVGIGEFHNDRLNGKALYFWESKATMTVGNWVNGELIGGNSIIRRVDGEIFIGETKDGGISHGYGISIMYNKIKSVNEYFIGTWEDGKIVEFESYIFE